MNQYEEGASSSAHREARYKGVRRRHWGKWVSEIRVPGTGGRLWLGSYASPEAAAVAHDAAVFFLRGPESSSRLNFPDRAAGYAWERLSPRTVQRVASECGMAVDAEMTVRGAEMQQQPPEVGEVLEVWGPEMASEMAVWGDISVDDMEIYM